MEENSTKNQESFRFSAHLTPHRSLSPSGFLIFMSAISFVCFVMGVVFMVIGAWPVVGFLGLDVALIYYAFKRNYADAKIFETINLTADQLELTRVYPSGRRQSWQFNPVWVDIKINEHSSGANAINLTSHGKSIGFAAFLSNEERREFADVLRREIATARASLYPA